MELKQRQFGSSVREKKGICVGCALGRERRQIFFLIIFLIKKKKDENKLGCISYSACWFCVGTVAQSHFGPLMQAKIWA